MRAKLARRRRAVKGYLRQSHAQPRVGPGGQRQRGLDALVRAEILQQLLGIDRGADALLGLGPRLSDLLGAVNDEPRDALGDGEEAERAHVEAVILALGEGARRGAGDDCPGEAALRRAALLLGV